MQGHPEKDVMKGMAGNGKRRPGGNDERNRPDRTCGEGRKARKGRLTKGGQRALRPSTDSRTAKETDGNLHDNRDALRGKTAFRPVRRMRLA